MQAMFMQSRLVEWLKEEEIDAEETSLVVKPAVSSSAVGIEVTQGEEETLMAVGALLEDVSLFLPAAIDISLLQLCPV